MNLPVTKKRDIHIVPHCGGWETKKEGARRVGVVKDTQFETSRHARQQAK
ncbi:DUF2188 domain-containing protein [Caballeronia terrestris]|nr:DUF2188 domain-containing protein [Caballeronia terrestris]